MERFLLHLIVSIPLLRPHDYLDPGSGSILIQVLIAVLVGVGFIARTFWGRIKGIFTRGKTAKDDDSAE